MLDDNTNEPTPPCPWQANVLPSPLQAIRAECLSCCNGSAHEVNLCPSKGCALWPFRFGRRQPDAYSRVGARIAEYRWPKLEDFFTLDRDVSNAKVDEKYIDGERFQYKVLDRKALFPLRPGEYTLGAVSVEVEAGNSPFFAAERRTLRTRPVRIKVEPLLAEGRPADFESGNVGDYTLSARWTPPRWGSTSRSPTRSPSAGWATSSACARRS